ncbi:hypothetical protein WR25_22966 [Diploscapter pachys]|uniref:Protein kinase domain-containing protein n=1 Tax=Diploscapter pachys TaxID=2018661 RepID=A0A2A2JCT4_9BILA|nr:hypothetical protein WR25_22966 [Diploscapter pachys]
MEEWPEGYQLATAMNFRFTQTAPTPMEQIVNTIGKDGMKLMLDMMIWNPERRPNANQCLRYKYFQVNEKLGAPVMSQPAPGVVRKHSAGSTQSDTKAVLGKVKKDYPGSENISPQQQGKMIERNHNRSIPLNKSTVFEKNDKDRDSGNVAAERRAKDFYMTKSRYIPGAVTKEGGNNAMAANAGGSNSAKNEGRSAVQTRFQYAYGYVPNFGARTLNQPTDGKSGNHLLANSATNSNGLPNKANNNNAGRIDWAAK